MWSEGGIPCHDSSEQSPHWSRNVGPNIYEVNESYIKPRTLLAGNTSWALMLHPAGLRCDTYVTHAWSEGVFEFLIKIRKMRPWRSHHIYICFLSNPQNADISNLLGEDPMDSPFAHALLMAENFLVLPNHTVSIYTRLWCVFEIHVAMTHCYDIAIPTRPKKRWVLPELFAGIFVLVVSYMVFEAIWFNIAIVGDKIEISLGPIDIDHIELSHSVLVPFAVLLRHSRPCGSPRLVSWIILICVSFAMSVHFEHNSACSLRGYLQSLKANQNQCMIPHLLFVCAALRYAWRVQVDRVRNREADLLDCESVEKANCSHPDDEFRIKDAIHGDEQRIDSTILTLRTIGWWSPAVDTNRKLGVHVDRLGDGIFLEILAGGCCYWVLAFRNITLFFYDAWKSGAPWSIILFFMLVVNIFSFTLVHYVRAHAILVIDTLGWTGAICHVSKSLLRLLPNDRKQYVFVSYLYIVALNALLVLRAVARVWNAANEPITQYAVRKKRCGEDSEDSHT